MASARAQGIAMAAVDLFGALTDAAVGAGLTNLAISAVRSDYKPNLKRLSGQLTGLMNARLGSMTRPDREALSEAIGNAMRSLNIDDELVRATTDPERLKQLMVARSATHLGPVVADPVTRLKVDALLRIVCDWISQEIKLAPKFVPVRLNQLQEDVLAHGELVRGLDASQSATRARLDAQAVNLSDLEKALALVRNFEAVSVASPAGLFVSIVDHRPSPVRTVGRDAELDEVTRGVSSRGSAVISGRNLSGRFEIARAWCSVFKPIELAYAVDFRSPEQLTAAARTLAAEHAVDTSGDIATVLARLLWSRPNVSVVICGIDQPDLVERLIAAVRPDGGALMLTVPAHLGPQFNGFVETTDLDEMQIGELLDAELREMKLPGLHSLAATFEGLPESARVTAAMLREAGADAAALLSRLVSDPARVLTVPLSESDRERTQADVWDRSLEHFTRTEGHDARLLLGLLHVVQARALDPQLLLATALLWSGGDESVSEETTEAYVLAKHALIRRGLASESSGFVGTLPLLVSRVVDGFGSGGLPGLSHVCGSSVGVA